jgi:urease accessory protein
VGADLEVMRSDTEKVRGIRPYVFTDMLRRKGLDEVIAFLEHKGGLQRSNAPAMSA